MQEIFEKIYRIHHWYDAESKSGPGSSLRQTKTVRTTLSTVFKEFNIKTILDIPCGDFHWMKEVDFTPYQYCGADIVDEIIQQNQLNYSNDKRQFVWADITSSPLPKTDLIFCRDCLVHFSFADIKKALLNIKRSRSQYLLATTFPNRLNKDVTTGSWRPINLQSAPFLLPPPLQVYNENCTEGRGIYIDKSLALWTIDSLEE